MGPFIRYRVETPEKGSVIVAAPVGRSADDRDVAAAGQGQNLPSSGVCQPTAKGPRDPERIAAESAKDRMVQSGCCTQSCVFGFA